MLNWVAEGTRPLLRHGRPVKSGQKAKGRVNTPSHMRKPHPVVLPLRRQPQPVWPLWNSARQSQLAYSNPVNQNRQLHNVALRVQPPLQRRHFALQPRRKRHRLVLSVRPWNVKQVLVAAPKALYLVRVRAKLDKRVQSKLEAGWATRPLLKPLQRLVNRRQRVRVTVAQAQPLLPPLDQRVPPHLVLPKAGRKRTRLMQRHRLRRRAAVVKLQPFHLRRTVVQPVYVQHPQLRPRPLAPPVKLNRQMRDKRVLPLKPKARRQLLSAPLQKKMQLEVQPFVTRRQQQQLVPLERQPRPPQQCVKDLPHRPKDGTGNIQPRPNKVVLRTD